MCIGIPMRVIAVDGSFAWCEGRNGRQRINTFLIGEVPVGQWLLTHLDTARELLDEERAMQVNTALDGLQSLSNGEEIDINTFFSDLVDREPQLPDFLTGGVSND
jgi:hydrogenase expression/formation protein HypC